MNAEPENKEEASPLGILEVAKCFFLGKKPDPDKLPNWFKKMAKNAVLPEPEPEPEKWMNGLFIGDRLTVGPFPESVKLPYSGDSFLNDD